MRETEASPPALVSQFLVSQLELEFIAIGGRTHLRRAYSRGALKVLRPFPYGEGLVLQLLTLGPGLMGGDQVEIRVHVAPGAKVILLNQSATKVLPARGDRPVVQRLLFRVEGFLEYYPGLTIPHPASALDQRMEVSLGTEASFSWMEMYALGRLARGEVGKFKWIRARTAIFGQVPFHMDALELLPEELGPNHPGVLEGHLYLVCGFWNWESHPFFEETENGLLGVGLTAFRHSFLRGIGNKEVTQRALKIWSQERALRGLPAVDVMRYSSAL